MTDLTYSTANQGCRRNDEDCLNKMAFDLLAEVIDKNTTGQADGVITETQMADFVGSDGEVNQSDIENAIREYAGRHPSIVQTYLPSSGQVELYIAERYPDVYQKVFKVEFQPPAEGDVAGIKAVLKKDILELAKFNEDGAGGRSQSIAPWRYFVETYLDGYGVPNEFNAILVMKIGGERNVEIARTILRKAMGEAPKVGEARSCNNNNLRPCYAAVATALRGFAGAIDKVKYESEPVAPPEEEVEAIGPSGSNGDSGITASLKAFMADYKLQNVNAYDIICEADENCEVTPLEPECTPGDPKKDPNICLVIAESEAIKAIEKATVVGD